MIHCPVNGHLGWFPFLTVMNKAAMNILTHHRVFVKIKISNYSNMFNTEIFFKVIYLFQKKFFGCTMQH